MLLWNISLPVATGRTAAGLFRWTEIKGILERDLERLYPDRDTEIIMYCGGGYRSVLTADAAQRMGYRNVSSLADGYRALVQANWEIESGS